MVWDRGPGGDQHRLGGRETPSGTGGSGKPFPTGYSGISSGTGAGPGFAGGRAARGGPAGEHAPARPGPAPCRPPAEEPLSRAWLVCVCLLDPGTAACLGTGLGGGADLGLGGLGSRRRRYPLGPASRTPSPSFCSPLLRGARSGVPVLFFPSPTSVPAGDPARPLSQGCSRLRS